MACAKFVISGKVQGVFFRAAARAEAERLGVAGYAKNLADGSVEVLACGDARALNEFEAWLRRGPRLARVAQVLRTAGDDESQVPADFRTL